MLGTWYQKQSRGVESFFDQLRLRDLASAPTILFLMLSVSLGTGTVHDIKMQDCQSRPFCLEPEPFFWSGSGSYFTVSILFLWDPKYEYESLEV